MSDIYTKEKGIHSTMDDEYLEDDLYLVKEEKYPSMFHLGQSYEKQPAKKLSCSKCGNGEFNVGQGGYFTVIRCPKCEWELCIHDG